MFERQATLMGGIVVEKVGRERNHAIEDAESQRTPTSGDWTMRTEPIQSGRSNLHDHRPIAPEGEDARGEQARRDPKPSRRTVGHPPN
jgi:hypothetical protein